MDDVARLVEDQPRHQQHKGGGDGQRERRDFEEDRCQPGKEGEQNADHQEAAHEAEVLACRQRVAGQRKEDHGSTCHRHHHRLSAVRQTEVVTDDRAQRVAHEAGQREDGQQPPAAVAQLGRQEEQAEVADQRDDHARVRQAHRERQAGGERREEQRHRQQHVGVADHLVARQNGLGSGVR